MVNLIVEHRWKEKNQEAAFKVVGSIVEMAKNGKLPQGFSLKSINVIGSERMAICNWEAPSLNDLKGLVEQVNPPTKYEIFEAQKLL
ncbi:MAG: hypothetical protein M1304_02780 [Candidatus Thermoplasmatota archaeon]|jgi:hypothetical protein|nr:hypothetical protein [Candidatus Thermoplasmatota archaeon]MCL5732675.1 hypothetical protein [Candidatus Thermoplasmatota archaeon]